MTVVPLSEVELLVAVAVADDVVAVDAGVDERREKDNVGEVVTTDPLLSLELELDVVVAVDDAPTPRKMMVVLCSAS